MDLNKKGKITSKRVFFTVKCDFRQFMISKEALLRALGVITWQNSLLFILSK